MKIRWTLILIGLLVGLAGSWAFGAFVQPVRYVDTDPSALADTYKNTTVVMVAAAYQYDGDLGRAQARLVSLGYNDPAGAVAALAQQGAATAAYDATTLQWLGQLAFALETGGGQIAQPATPTLPTATTEAVAVIPSDTPPAPPANTPIPDDPAATFTPPPVFDYVLVSREIVCDPTLSAPLLQVTVLDAAGNPLPGVALDVRGASGNAGRFVTGLKPDFGLGYADFVMQPDDTYTLTISAQTPPITDLQASPCTTESGSAYPGSVRVIFSRSR